MISPYEKDTAQIFYLCFVVCIQTQPCALVPQPIVILVIIITCGFCWCVQSNFSLKNGFEEHPLELPLPD